MKFSLLAASSSRQPDVSLSWREMRVGQCGGCELQVRFWAQDGARLTCPNRGLTHEVECAAHSGDGVNDYVQLYQMFTNLNYFMRITCQFLIISGMERDATETGETMNVKQACEYLEISRPTLMRRIAQGELKPLPKPRGLKRHYRLGFYRVDVERLVRGAL